MSLSYQDSNGDTNTNDFTPQSVSMSVDNPGTFKSNAAGVAASVMVALLMVGVATLL
jgi:hypothetical protein